MSVELGARVFVAGHRGLVGSALVRRLAAEGFGDVVTADRETVNLADFGAVDAFFSAQRPRFVFLAAARVGGILANDTYAGDFIRDNLAIQLSVLDAARRHGVETLLFLGSSCVYPKLAPQPIREESLLTGPQLEAEIEAAREARADASPKPSPGWRTRDVAKEVHQLRGPSYRTRHQPKKEKSAPYPHDPPGARISGNVVPEYPEPTAPSEMHRTSEYGIAAHWRCKEREGEEDSGGRGGRGPNELWLLAGQAG